MKTLFWATVVMLVLVNGVLGVMQAYALVATFGWMLTLSLIALDVALYFCWYVVTSRMSTEEVEATGKVLEV